MSKIKVDTIQSTQYSSSTIGLTSTGATVNGDCNATTFTGSGANLTALPAANLTGTVPDAAFPATLPTASGANLTNLPSANLTGAIPANLLTNAGGGGGLEFVKEISPSSSVSSITETGLDYDKVYRLVVKKLRVDQANSDLVIYPHMDGSSTEFDWSVSPYNLSLIHI